MQRQAIPNKATTPDKDNLLENFILARDESVAICIELLTELQHACNSFIC